MRPSNLKRKLSKTGYTEAAETTDIEIMPTVLKDLAKIFNPIGPTNFQFRKFGNDLKLLEINPRVSSATSIRTAFGYNESLMAVDYYLHNKYPKQPQLKKVVQLDMWRTWYTMKIALISDIHGNYPALKKVLDELDKMSVDTIYCLGDVTGYYTQINECCEELRKRCIKSIMGNHDWYLVSNGFCPRSRAADDCIQYQKNNYPRKS